jgi:hypothetical protein
MPISRAQELREIAQRATEVANLISEGPLDQFQTEVRSELRPHGSDVELQGVERQLRAVAVAIETYLRGRTG